MIKSEKYFFLINYLLINDAIIVIPFQVLTPSQTPLIKLVA